jgi:5-methylcytosine-specific restriction endonuclease McrA
MPAAKSERLKVPQWAMFRIAQRDGWRCHVCDGEYRTDDPWEIDHDTPLANGGTNHVRNMRLAHRSCNRDKGVA